MQKRIIAILLIATSWTAMAQKAKKPHHVDREVLPAKLKIIGPSIMRIGDHGDFKVVDAHGLELPEGKLTWKLSGTPDPQRFQLTRGAGLETRLRVNGTPRKSHGRSVLLFARLNTTNGQPALTAYKKIHIDAKNATTPWLAGVNTLVNGSVSALPSSGDLVEIEADLHAPKGWTLQDVSVQPDHFTMPDEFMANIPVRVQATFSDENGDRFVYNFDEHIRQRQVKPIPSDEPDPNWEIMIRNVVNLMDIWALQFANDDSASEAEKEFSEVWTLAKEWLCDDTPEPDNKGTDYGWANSFDKDGNEGVPCEDIKCAQFFVHRPTFDDLGEPDTIKTDNHGGERTDPLTVKKVVVHEMRHIWQFCKRVESGCDENEPMPDDEWECDAQIFESQWGVDWPEEKADEVIVEVVTTPGSETVDGSGTAVVQVLKNGLPLEGVSVLFGRRTDNVRFISDPGNMQVASSDGISAATITDAEGMAYISFDTTTPGKAQIDVIPIANDAVAKTHKFEAPERL